MPDLDTFETLARQWKPLYNRYIDEHDSTIEQLAQDILSLTIEMLIRCGGCTLLHQLVDVLWEYSAKLNQQTVWNDDPSQMSSFYLEQNLDRITQRVVHRRIEMVAIRSTHTIALALQRGVLDAYNRQALQEVLATQIVQDLIRHCCLDTTRAHSIGTRFSNGDGAYIFYQKIMTALQPGITSLAQQLSLHPDGQTLFVLSTNPKLTRKKLSKTA